MMLASDSLNLNKLMTIQSTAASIFILYFKQVDTMDHEVHFSNNKEDKLTESFSVFSGQSSGIMSILSHYKSNSRIISFASWFSNLVKKLDGHLLPEDVRYRGNASDLWGLLAFQVKAIGAIFTQNNYDISLVKKQIQLGQIYMLYKAQQNMTSSLIRQQLNTLYQDKIKKFKEELVSIRQSKMKKTQKSNGSDKPTILNLQNVYKIEDADLQQYLKCFNKQNEDKIWKKLKEFLKMLLKMVNKYPHELANDKIKLIIILVCYQLLIVLKNMNWHTLCLSDLNVTQYLIRYLPEVNGVLKISKFLHDASRTTLEEQLYNQHQSLFKYQH